MFDHRTCRFVAIFPRPCCQGCVVSGEGGRSVLNAHPCDEFGRLGFRLETVGRDFSNFKDKPDLRLEVRRADFSRVCVVANEEGGCDILSAAHLRDRWAYGPVRSGVGEVDDSCSRCFLDGDRRLGGRVRCFRMPGAGLCQASDAEQVCQYV